MEIIADILHIVGFTILGVSIGGCVLQAILFAEDTDKSPAPLLWTFGLTGLLLGIYT